MGTRGVGLSTKTRGMGLREYLPLKQGDGYVHILTTKTRGMGIRKAVSMGMGLCGYLLLKW